MKARQFSTKGQVFLGFFNCESCDKKWCKNSEYLQKQPCPRCKKMFLPILLKKIYETLFSDEYYTCYSKCRHGNFTKKNCKINEKYNFCKQCDVKKFPDEIKSLKKNGRNIELTQSFIYAKFQCKNQQCQHKWEKRQTIKLTESKKCPQCKTETYPLELQRGKYFEENVRYHGIFNCDCKNTWSSRYSWLNETQQCESCVNYFYFASELKVVNRNIDSTLYQKFTAVFDCFECDKIWEKDGLKYGQTEKCCGYKYFPYLLENNQISFNDIDKYVGKYQCDCQYAWKQECYINQDVKCQKCQIINYPKELKLIKIKSTNNQIFKAFFECTKCKQAWDQQESKYGQSSKCLYCNDNYFPYLLENERISFNDKDKYNGKFLCECENDWQDECFMNQQIKCKKCKKLNLAKEISLISLENHQQDKCSKCLKLGKSCVEDKERGKVKEVNESQYKYIDDVNDITQDNNPSKQRKNQKNPRNSKKKPQRK